MNLQTFIIDVDGVMTDGKFYYDKTGKVMKAFGPDDHDALSLLKPSMDIQFVTGDHRGFEISKARIVDDMKYPLHLVSTVKRVEWIAERFALQNVVYMGDGIFDSYVFERVGYSIAPANADAYLKAMAKFVTKRRGGDRAVAEAALHLLEKIEKPFQPAQGLRADLVASGSWQV